MLAERLEFVRSIRLGSEYTLKRLHLGESRWHNPPPHLVESSLFLTSRKGIVPYTLHPGVDFFCLG